MTAAALRELQRRALIANSILDRTFPQQRAFILERARLGAALCSRRAGKTEGLAWKLIFIAATKPGARCLYLGLTKGTARVLMWERLKLLLADDELARLIGVTPDSYNEVRMWLTLRNGSVIRCSGADANRKEMEKLLGDALDYVAIDEAASFTVDLLKLSRDIVWPALMDRGGHLDMTGTPGDVRNYFYDVTGLGGASINGIPWAVHRWNTRDNPHMRAQYQREIAGLSAEYMSTPEFQCMYLGRWTVDATRLVYAFQESKNIVDAPPKHLQSRTIAVDLGQNDSTAVVAYGRAPFDSTDYILSAFKAPGMSIEAVANKVREVIAQDPSPYKLVIDGAWKQSVMELRSRYMLPFVATEKTEKNAHIRMMNTDLLCGRVKLVAGMCDPLVTEWRELVWDQLPNGDRRENQRQPNDCADAALYGWRFNRAYSAEAMEPVPTDAERVERFWTEEAERLERERLEAIAEAS